MMPKRKHELDLVTAQLLGEIQQLAPKFAESLFPQGPAGHKVLPREALLDMVANNWQDKSFRVKLLERMAPPGPDGMPAIEKGVDDFIKLYTDAMLRRDNAEQNLPLTEAGAIRAIPPTLPVVQSLGPGTPETMGTAPSPAASPSSAGPVATSTGPASSLAIPLPPPYPGAG
jgi:hypothetical protein